MSLAVDHEDDDETLNKPDSVDDSEFASSKSWAEMMEGTQRRWNIVSEDMSTSMMMMMMMVAG